jgi:hypothetical protein
MDRVMICHNCGEAVTESAYYEQGKAPRLGFYCGCESRVFQSRENFVDGRPQNADIPDSWEKRLVDG